VDDVACPPADGDYDGGITDGSLEDGSYMDERGGCMYGECVNPGRGCILPPTGPDDSGGGCCYDGEVVDETGACVDQSDL
jgi:hypothetical protein